VNTAHLTVSSGGSAASIFTHNGLGGIQVFGVGQADLSGNIQITSNGGSYGLLVLNNSGVAMTNGIISGNSGLGVHCGGTSHCEFVTTQISGNGAGGIEVVEHSDTSLDNGVIISGNTGNGVLVNQASSLTSEGGNTIGGNTIDGLVVDTVSVINFQATDTITATAGNLALNCNNGSFVMGDVSTYKPKKMRSRIPGKSSPLEFHPAKLSPGKTMGRCEAARFLNATLSPLFRQKCFLLFYMKSYCR
jgi:hypothetical protein